MDFLTPTYKYSLNNHFDYCIPRPLVGSLVTQFTQTQTFVQRGQYLPDTESECQPLLQRPTPESTLLYKT